MRISVVIPTLNEEETISRALGALPPGVEAIVADGGSTDRTRELARSRAQVVEAPRGRGVQLNAGAARAEGDVLLFLHVDARLPSRGFAEIDKAIRGGFVGGGFLGRFDSRHPAFLFAYPFRDWRARELLEIYGDQGIFARRDVFESMGGFRPVPIMEDLDFVRRLRRRGPVKVIAYPILISARRYRARGVLRQHLVNVWIRQRWGLGGDPGRLHAMYES